MQHLGFTRSSVKPDHALLTPDTFIRAPLPGFVGATCIVHIAPQLGAGFVQYTAELEDGGQFGLAPSATSRFVYVLGGSLMLTFEGQNHTLEASGYAYLPPEVEHTLSAIGAARAMVIEKVYQPLEDVDDPEWVVGKALEVVSSPLAGNEGIQVSPLLPASPAFDCAVNLMTFAPGASLHLVEIHVMEHGLTMLEGQGIYRLSDAWYPVTQGDVIYMAPYCPQWFGALGREPSRYLIYKDWNRHPLE